MPVRLEGGGTVVGYLEVLEGAARVEERSTAGEPVVMATGRTHYLGGWLDETALRRVIARACAAAGIDILSLPEGLRRRNTGAERFWFNYSTEERKVAGRTLPPLSVLRETR